MSQAPAAPAAAAGAAAALAWVAEPGQWRLRLAGNWLRGAVPHGSLQPPPVGAGGVERVVVDAGELAAWDGDFAPALWRVLLPLARRGLALDLDTLPAAPRAAIQLALDGLAHDGDDRDALPPPPREARALAAAERSVFVFVGEIALALVAWARGRATLRGTGFVALLDQAGARCVPIVALTTALVGLMLAYMGGAQLERIGAQTYIADVVTAGIVRELAAMMTGIILAGRVGAAFAAQLATMQASEEIDALRTLGIDPMEHLVLPRLVAIVAMALPLLALSMLVGVLASVPAAVGAYGMTLPEYLGRCLSALTWTHLWIGLGKGTMYAALVALAGCLEGLAAGRNAQAVGEATTRAVVKALVWIVAAASLSTIVLSTLGY